VVDKEKLLENGKLVLLKLAPVDPRSLMQGDYMRLSYEVSTDVNTDSIAKRGYCIVKLDDKGIARRERLQADIAPLNKGEFAIFYTVAGSMWRINIGAESYFFEEGQAEKYEAAEYGGLMVDKEGENVLVGLYDENLALIE
jgi:uncharacterized membrane-anchored protein